MVRPIGRPMARKTVTLEDLREEFLAHCEARNLSGKTLEWYDAARDGSPTGAPKESPPFGPSLDRPRAVRAGSPSSGLRAEHRAWVRAGPEDPVPAWPSSAGSSWHSVPLPPG